MKGSKRDTAAIAPPKRPPLAMSVVAEKAAGGPESRGECLVGKEGLRTPELLRRVEAGAAAVALRQARERGLNIIPAQPIALLPLCCQLA